MFVSSLYLIQQIKENVMSALTYIVVTMANRKNYYVARQGIGGTYSVVCYATSEDVAKKIAHTFNKEIKA